MNNTTVVVYAVIVGVAVLSSILKKRKKANTNTAPKKNVSFNQSTQIQYKKPASTQPKSLEDILQSLLGEQKIQKPVAPKMEEKLVFTDKEPNKYTTLEETEALDTLEKEEVQYYGLDTELNYTEELVDYDKTTDHRLHGAGFDQIAENEEVEEESEWAVIDWRKAIITAEILKRPQY